MAGIRARGHSFAAALLFVAGLGVLFAPGASATSQTAFTCAAAEIGGAFSDAHCLTAASGKGFKHVAITESTSVSLTNSNTAEATSASAVSKLRGSLAGVETEIQCTTVAGSGTLQNSESAGEMLATVTGVIGYSSCTVTKPAGKGCVVKGGAITTNNLAGTTAGQAENSVKVTPASETNFATIQIEKCTIESLNNNFPITGSLVVNASGPTLTETHAGITTQNMLKFGGTKVGIESAITLKGPSGAGIGLTTGEPLPPPVSVTAYTCAATEAGASFTDAHCLKAGSGKGFKRVAIGETTTLSGTNSGSASETAAAAPTRLKGTIGGTETEVECSSVAAAGTVENSENGAEKVVRGSGAIEYSGCTVAKPAGKGCTVKGGKFTTKTLTFSSQEQFGSVSASPTTGTELGAVTIEGCSVGINGTKALTGSVKMNPSGPTLTSTHAETTTQNTLKLDGVKAGLEGSLTLKAKTIGGETAPTPLTLVQE